MSFVLASLAKDIARWRRDIAAILIWILVPLFIGGLITALMGGEGAKPHGVLLVVDQDGSLLSGLFAGAYSGGELGELLTVEKTTLEDGTQLIEAGKASGLLVIPPGFGRALTGSEPVTLTLKTNPSQSILPEIIRSVAEILLDAGFYVHALFGDEVQRILNMDAAPTDAEVALTSVEMRQRIDALAPRLFPPAIDLEVAEPPPAEPAPSLAVLFLPGVILMALLFAANGLAADFWRERMLGTLRRVAFAPGRIAGFVAGKALGAALVMGLVGGLTLVIGFAWHGIDWFKLPVSLIWITVSGVALFAWLAALQMMFGNQRIANLVSTMLMFPLLMAGGSFFPLSVMPGWIAAIGRVSPNGFIDERLSQELTGTGVALIGAGSWLGMCLAALAGVAVCGARLKGGFARA
jgi:ABC-type Na+ efflux pump permease subunit